MKKFALLVLVLLSSALGASAQEAPRGDLSVGYSYFREGFSGGANAQGGSFSGAGYLNSWLGIVGDFGLYHTSQSGINANTYTYMGGPRFSIARSKSVSPFVQFLAGGTHVDVSGFGSGNGSAFSGGGGLDLALSRHIAFRPQFDYIALHSSGGTLHCGRASLSVVFRFGGR